MTRIPPKVTRLLLDDLTAIPLRQIASLFEDNGIELGPENPDDHDSSERRRQGRRYLATLNLEMPSDHERLLGVLTDRMQAIDRDSLNWTGGLDLRDSWMRTLASAGLDIDPVTYVVSDPEPPTQRAITFTPMALAAISDPGAIHDHLSRLHDAVDSDPRLAVSTARALIESTAKLVLTKRGRTYTKGAKVPTLVTSAQESLGLAAKGVSEEEPELRKLLQSLVTLTQGVTEIRNRVGVDHGAESVPNWVKPRHARLVVGAAQVWCQLMLETLADPSAPWRTRPEDS
ncbi:abortive infection family protein [Ornithinimicrobium flavum]|uniref:abortive infection family protein n=1 Tax=Ornithinimicrobium flavum TaxID=1288636 RepID=UPI00106F0EC0|nr:abortive infection family protein [Ornithinimicrobium flavum]